MIALKRGTKVRVSCHGRRDLDGKVASVVGKAPADTGGKVKLGITGWAYELQLDGGARIWIDAAGVAECAR